jgi:hypothetical protein
VGKNYIERVWGMVGGDCFADILGVGIDFFLLCFINKWEFDRYISTQGFS